MALIADGLMISAALAAALYCYVLSRKINNLMRLDTGLGGAISALSLQVDEIETSVRAATKASGASLQELVDITSRAEIAAGRLELLMVSVYERGKTPKKVEMRNPKSSSDEAVTSKDILNEAQEPLLSAIEAEKNAATRVDLLNALQKVMTAVK